jgi:tRNA nucleotidyltransferase (CCA-adding enzyme)
LLLMEMDWPAPVVSVLNTLEAGGYEAYLVGGCVRDRLLGRPVTDFDVATNATPDQVVSLFPRTVPTGLKHGTVTVLSEGLPVEVTTYRKDIGYSDGRRPDKVAFCHSLEEDLSRRDFTVNAMAMDVRGHIVDCFGGRSDLARRVIRAVGVPSHRFQEDGLRILRAFRFAAQLGFQLDDDTWRGMEQNAKKLRAVSPERIGVEVAKIAAADWSAVIDSMAKSEIWAYVDPHLRPLQQGFKRLSTAAKSLQSWMKPHAVEDRIAEALAIWCHAAGLTPTSCRAMGRALRWSNQYCQEAGDFLELLQANPLKWSTWEWRRHLFEFGEGRVERACAALDIWENVGDDHRPRWTLFREYAQTQPIWRVQDVQISGQDIVALGARGPLVGQVKQQLTEDVLMKRVLNDRSHLLKRATALIHSLAGGTTFDFTDG